MNFAREGLAFIIVAALIAAAAYTAALTRRSWPLWLLAFTLTLVALWVAYFFRDPERTGPRGEQLVIAPADGKVVLISDVDEPAFMGGRSRRVSIFMNVFNVHVNRYPSRGMVAHRAYVKGRFGHAGPEKASTDNEQSSTGEDTPRGRVLIRQIAGSVARRIVTDHSEGTEVAQAQRMGLIRFGSRVDVFVPAGVDILVKVGDKTKAAQTVIARWK